MTGLQQPIDPNNPIVYLDIQIGLENGKPVFRLFLIKTNSKLCTFQLDAL